MPFLLRVELPDVPGSLGRLATAIGEAGGDIEAIEIVEKRHDGVIAIPKASSVEHVEANAEALEIQFDPEDLERLDHAFPPPTHETPLDII